ncbi:stage III sporulation protein AF [Paenibacillus sp. CMAA1364]
MTWLNEWMREVIMIVLLATFVDLILPSRSMERYVKLVLSLLILLTLMQPIIRLLTDSPEAKLSAAFVNQEMSATHFTNGKETTLQQIMSEAEKIKSQQQTQSLQWTGEEIARQMKQQIEQKTGKQVQEVMVFMSLTPLEKEERAVSPWISSVDVVMQQPTERSEGSSVQDAPNSMSVTPIDPIKVEIDVGTVDIGTVPLDQNGPQNNPPEEATIQQIQGAEDIQKLLSNEWNLKAEQIRVLTKDNDVKV